MRSYRRRPSRAAGWVRIDEGGDTFVGEQKDDLECRKATWPWLQELNGGKGGKKIPFAKQVRQVLSVEEDKGDKGGLVTLGDGETFENPRLNEYPLSFATPQHFFRGLDWLVGKPSPDTLDAMEREHNQPDEKDKPVPANNFGTVTFAQAEWLWVVDPHGRDAKWSRNGTCVATHRRPSLHAVGCPAPIAPHGCPIRAAHAPRSLAAFLPTASPRSEDTVRTRQVR